jgi:putative acetyltransferase
MMLSTRGQQTILVREAKADDAEPLLAYVHQLLSEPDNCIFLLALADGEIVGQLGLTGGVRQATRHSAVLGLSVRQGWRRRGVGTYLMTRAIRWAREGDVLSRIELFVYARNHGAIHLYERFGFQVEGRRRRAVLHKGEYLDDLLLALLLC